MKHRTSRISTPVVIGLILAVVLDTFIQITWKLAVSNLPAAAPVSAAATAVLKNGYFYAAMAGFAAQLFNWVRVLAHADLSFAQPFTALSYITVMAISHAMLHEAISPSRLIGVGLILVGVFFISRTPVCTPPLRSGGDPLAGSLLP